LKLRDSVRISGSGLDAQAFEAINDPRQDMLDTFRWNVDGNDRPEGTPPFRLSVANVRVHDAAKDWDDTLPRLVRSDQLPSELRRPDRVLRNKQQYDRCVINGLSNLGEVRRTWQAVDLVGPRPIPAFLESEGNLKRGVRVLLDV
jgi:hypothetical protein